MDWEIGRRSARDLQRLAHRGWPRGWHPGGLGWALVDDPLGDRVAAATVDGRLVAVAAVFPTGETVVQLDPADPADPAVAAAAAAHLVSLAPALTLEVIVPLGDRTLAEALAAVGFTADPEPVRGMFRPAGPGRRPPEGYRIRPVGVDEVAERVEAHRRAWRPADLPWHPDHRPEVEPGATSRFTAARYAEVRATWLYDPGLDLVVEAPDGTLAGCCVGWYDPGSGCAEIEPLGVVPEYRRLGLAGALCHAIGERVAARGGSEVFINVSPSVAYPASSGAYRKAGFEVRERGTLWRREPSAGAR